VPSPVLRVRVARSDLEALDRRAGALGVRRSDVARSLLCAGLAADGSSASAPNPLAVESARVWDIRGMAALGFGSRARLSPISPMKR
jgi:hypothetical protein